MAPDGTVTPLHWFNGTDGENLQGALVQGADGNLYGTTVGGGANGQGTIFKITTAGVLTTLHDFNGTDGSGPLAGLIQAADGNFYGTAGSGAFGDGVLFRMTPEGTLSVLHTFVSAGGSLPTAALLQETNGKFYGTTYQGGHHEQGCDPFGNGCGTVFSLSVGLRPFVETQPTSGTTGAAVKILGNNLTGATSVTFNGTAAVFHVMSSSFITATVPLGATSGKVQVTTPNLTLSSNVPFRLLP
jgi:uncharacterized repeat protein (TIGR03803 family)